MKYLLDKEELLSHKIIMYGRDSFGEFQDYAIPIGKIDKMTAYGVPECNDDLVVCPHCHHAAISILFKYCPHCGNIVREAL